MWKRDKGLVLGSRGGGKSGKEGFRLTICACHILPVHDPRLVSSAHQRRELLYRHVVGEDLLPCFLETEGGWLVGVDEVWVFAGVDCESHSVSIPIRPSFRPEGGGGLTSRIQGVILGISEWFGLVVKVVQVALQIDVCVVAAGSGMQGADLRLIEHEEVC